MCEFSEPAESFPTPTPVQILFDGLPVHLPAEATSLAAIRFRLETMALRHNRILCALHVDGALVNLADSLLNYGPFERIDAETIDVEQMPLQVVQTALQQITQSEARLVQAITRVLINNPDNARQLWWTLANELKHPLVSLSLVSDTASQGGTAGCSPLQLRKWQLQQLALIMEEIEAISSTEDVTALSDALEGRVFPWLLALRRSLELVQQTLLAHQWAGNTSTNQPGHPGPSPAAPTAVPFPSLPCPRLGQSFEP